MNESRPGTGGKRQPSTADTGTAGPELLAHALGAISRDLQPQDDPDSLRAGIVPAAVAVVPAQKRAPSVWSLIAVGSAPRLPLATYPPESTPFRRSATRAVPAGDGWLAVPQNRWVSRQPSAGTQLDGTPTNA